MRNVCFKKGLVIGIIVLFLRMSVVSSNAVTIQKETLVDEETTGEYCLSIVVHAVGIDPVPPFPFPNKVVVTHGDNPSFRIVKYGISPLIDILIPDIYIYPNVTIYSPGFEQTRASYTSYDHLTIYVKWVGFPRTLNNPFIKRLPILNQLLQLAVR